MHEASTWDYKCMFLTVTYDDKHLVYSIVNRQPTLSRRDGQLFIKRLRKKLSKKNRKIKAFYCGEYGEESGRPHMHFIIFGVENREKDRAIVRSCWSKCESVGFYFGSVTQNSSRYVVDYILKYPCSQADKDAFYRQGMEPPFKSSSQGLGLEFCESHADQLTKNLSTVNANGVKTPLPRYYLDKLGIQAKHANKNLYIARFLVSNKQKFERQYPDQAISLGLSQGEHEVRKTLNTIQLINPQSPLLLVVQEFCHQQSEIKRKNAQKMADIQERRKGGRDIGKK